MAKTSNTYDRGAALETARRHLSLTLGYEDVGPIRVAGQDCIVARVDERPAVLVWAPADEGPIRPIDQEYAQELAVSIDNGPADFIWATSGGTATDGYIFSWLPDKECQVSELPPAAAATDGKKGPPKRADATRFKQLHSEFDLLHEQIYAAREPVDSSNDLTAQLCKCIFLKMHLERHPDFRAAAGAPLLADIFQAAYVTEHGQRAVDEIKKAFARARSLPEYNVKDDLGNSFEIFDQDDFIKFRRPETYAAIATFLNHHRLTQPESTGIEDDMVGRAFDVMLRGRFEGKGGMGVYLTPQQVRDAMVQIVFHDVLTEDPGLLTRMDPGSNQPEFRICDPCCGSGGFLITSMREVRKHVDKLVGMSLAQRARLLHGIFQRGFEGADNAPNMVLLARINMALHGDAHPRVFQVPNSLTASIFIPESFDLILTNPPFKKGGITDKAPAGLLRSYQSAIDERGHLKPDGAALALGAKPDAKGRWKPVRSVDPAVLFIDRCVQLLKPGGRLLIVVPDGILCNSGDR